MITRTTTVATVSGVFADGIGSAAWHRPVYSDVVAATRSLPSDNYRRVQPRCSILVDHGGDAIGRLEHFELTTDGRLDAVAALYDDDPELRTGRWYWSAPVDCQRDGSVVGSDSCSPN